MYVMPWVLEAAEKLAAIREAAGYFACVATMDAAAASIQ